MRTARRGEWRGLQRWCQTTKSTFRTLLHYNDHNYSSFFFLSGAPVSTPFRDKLSLSPLHSVSPSRVGEVAFLPMTCLPTRTHRHVAYPYSWTSWLVIYIKRLSTAQYADEIKIFNVVSSKSVHCHLQNDTHSTAKWYHVKNLKIKTKSILFLHIVSNVSARLTTYVASV